MVATRSVTATGSGSVSAPFNSVAFASLPAASSSTGLIYSVSDIGGALFRSNGSRWLPLDNPLTLKTLGAQVSAIANVETIVCQQLLPAAFLQANDTLRIWTGQTKSGTTDTGHLIIRLGTAGTTSDDAIFTRTAAIAAANQSLGTVFDFSVVSATSIQQVGGGTSGATSSYTGAGAAQPAATTISNVSNPLYLSVSTRSSSTNDTVGVNSCQLQVLK